MHKLQATNRTDLADGVEEDEDDRGVLAQPRYGFVDVERVLRESLLIQKQHDYVSEVFDHQIDDQAGTVFPDFPILKYTSNVSFSCGCNGPFSCGRG